MWYAEESDGAGCGPCSVALSLQLLGRDYDLVWRLMKLPLPPPGKARVPLRKVQDRRVQLALQLLLDGRAYGFVQIAQMCSISLSRLRHLFKYETGLSLEQYLKLLRFSRARILMQSSHLLVKEVAAAVGISDLSHFVRDYKALYGETPKQTREAHGFPNQSSNTGQ